MFETTTITAEMRVAENSVGRCMKLLKRFDEDKLVAQMKDDERRLKKLAKHIQPISRKNWDLEKEIEELDEQIGNLITLRAEGSFNKNSTSPKVQAEEDLPSPLDDGKQPLFEQMFSLLLHEPRYLAELSHRCPKIDCSDFVRTIVVDIFGGRPKLEVLELKMFQQSMEMEFKRCKKSQSMGSLFRNGTASMQMLKEYALQGDGKECIKQMLREPITSLKEHDLNLEVESIKMYKEFIKRYEENTKKEWPRARTLESAEAAFNEPYIQKLYRPRIKQLEFVANHFLQCCIKNMDSLPWGVRWICRQLAELGQTYFPEATPYQWGSIVGGFLFLRLLNPAIIAPANFNICEKPPKNTGRALQFTAKILMKLLNGTQFNEIHMQALNGFLEDKKEIIQNFIVKLIAVEDLDYKIDVYRLIKSHQKRERNVTIQTSYNSLILFHKLLVQNKEIFKDPQDPMLRVVMQLGPFMTQKYKKKQNRTVTLRLALPDEEFTENDREAQKKRLYNVGSQDPVLKKCFDSLLNFAKNIDMNNYPEFHRSRGFFQFLQHVAQLSSLKNDLVSYQVNDGILAQEVIENLEEAVAYTNTELEENQTKYDISRFIITYYEQLKTFRSRVKKLSVHTNEVKKAYKDTKEHYKFLQAKKEEYHAVLDNVNCSTPLGMLDAPPEITLTHIEMEKLGLILWIHPEFEFNVKKYCNWVFLRVERGVYEVMMTSTVVFGANFDIFNQPLTITLPRLVKQEKRKQGHFTVEHDFISLNVTLLKKFLMKTFRDYVDN